MNKLYTFIVSLLMLVFLSSCDTETRNETKRGVEEAAQDADAALKEAGRETKEALKEASDDIREEVREERADTTRVEY